MSILDSHILTLAFSEEQAERLTGISRRQLSYWDRTGFFEPEYADTNRRVSFSRTYSFKNLVALRVLNKLRNEENVPLQHLREVSRKLDNLPNQSWETAKIYVRKRKVLIDEKGDGKLREIVTGQYVLKFDLKLEAEDTESRIRAYNERTKAAIGHFERQRNVNHNNLVISETRIPVKAIKNFHDAGYSINEIIDEYPSLTKKDVQAAITYSEGDKAA